jgi:hypothetical protein
MSLTITVAPDYIRVLKADFDVALKALPHAPATICARHLIERAIAFDLAKAANLSVHFKYGYIRRDAANPSEFEHLEIIGVDYADNRAQPLKAGNEQWNAGRRATATGQVYGFDAKGRPLNPYMNTGLNGRGLLGLFGPNHAVDNGGLLAVRTDEQTGKRGLFILGITRKYDNNAPALPGGFAKYANGSFVFDHNVMIDTQVEEFFEEVISDSVALMPEFANQVESRFDRTIAEIEEKRRSSVAADHRDEIHDQTVTALKLEQVRKYDPEFMKRLRDHFAASHECFAGPVLNDPRNTNNAWIESRLSWALFDDAAWEKIRGNNKFNYALTGGDDASSVVWHKFTPETIAKAYASHGTMMSMMVASYLLKAQVSDRQVLDQCLDVAKFLPKP